MSDKLKVTLPKEERYQDLLPSVIRDCKKKKTKKKKRRNWYAVSGRRSQYKIDSEELVETPEANRHCFLLL